MEFPDLHLFPENHPPSPYDRPLLVVKVGDGFLPAGLRVCAVGWLEKSGFSTGKVPDKCIKALITAHGDRIFIDGYRGLHCCTLCGRECPRIRWRGQSVRLLGHGHYLIRYGKTVYMAPELVLHYIRGHRYCPPLEFVQATLHGDFLTEQDLAIKWRRKENGYNRRSIAKQDKP